MAQYALPIADEQTTGPWTQGAGDGDGSFFDELDEGFGAGRGSGSGPDDATTYWVEGGDGTVIETTLSSVTDPTVHTGHIVRTRNRKNSASGQQIDIFISLNEGAASRASTSFTNVDENWTTRTISLSTAQAGAITSYADLQILTRHDEVGGGQPRSTQESAHELEVPDAPAGADVIQDVIMSPGMIVFPRS